MSSQEFIDRPSQNFDARAEGAAIKLLIIHYTGLPSLKESLDRLSDPASKVSAHYLIDEEGNIFRMVKEDQRAWHAGFARWQKESDINTLSIGIELQNPGHEWGLEIFPKSQMNALSALANEIIKRHDIRPEAVLGHSDVAPARKEDPGELFDWQFLADSGVGLWHGLDDAQTASTESLNVSEGNEFLLDMEKFGYDLEAQQTDQVVRAFQRHWRQASLTGKPDLGSLRALRALVLKSNQD